MGLFFSCSLIPTTGEAGTTISLELPGSRQTQANDYTNVTIWRVQGKGPNRARVSQIFPAGTTTAEIKNLDAGSWSFVVDAIVGNLETGSILYTGRNDASLKPNKTTNLNITMGNPEQVTISGWASMGSTGLPNEEVLGMYLVSNSQLDVNGILSKESRMPDDRYTEEVPFNGIWNFSMVRTPVDHNAWILIQTGVQGEDLFFQSLTPMDLGSESRSGIQLTLGKETVQWFETTFDYNGGEDENSNSHRRIMTPINGSLTIPSGDNLSNSGSDFLGWNSDQYAQTANILPGNSVTVTQDQAYYAIWYAH